MSDVPCPKCGGATYTYGHVVGGQVTPMKLSHDQRVRNRIHCVKCDRDGVTATLQETPEPKGERLRDMIGVPTGCVPLGEQMDEGA